MPEVFPRDVLLRVGMRRHGRLVVSGGGIELPYTFSRADAATCAAFGDRDAGVRKAVAHGLRLDWPSGLVNVAGEAIGGFLSEGARANGWTKSEKTDDAAWTKTRATITANATTAPDGAVTADKIVEDATAGNTHSILRLTPTALTANTLQGTSFFAKAAERLWTNLVTTDKAGAAANSWVNLATGAVGTKAAGHVITVVPYSSAWYRLLVMWNSGTGGSAPALTVRTATTDGVSATTGDSVSGIYVWGLQHETDLAFPSSYISTDASAVTRAADSLTVPYNFGPLPEMTVLIRLARPTHADVVGALGISPGIFSFGAGAAARIGAYFDPAARNIIAAIDTASSDGVATVAIPAGHPTICIQYKNLTTGGQCSIDTGSASSGFGTTATPFSQFSSQVARIGRYDDELFGVTGELIAARGLFTRSEMMAIP